MNGISDSLEKVLEPFEQIQKSLETFHKIGEAVSLSTSCISTINNEVIKLTSACKNIAHVTTPYQPVIDIGFNYNAVRNVNDSISTASVLTKQLDFLDGLRDSLAGIIKPVSFEYPLLPEIFSVEGFFEYHESIDRVGSLLDDAKRKFQISQQIICEVEILYKQFEESKNACFLFQIQKIINDAHSIVKNRLSITKKWVVKLIARLYYNDSAHKIFFKLVSKKMFKIPVDDEDNSSVLQALELSKIKPSYYGRKISIN